MTNGFVDMQIGLDTFGQYTLSEEKILPNLFCLPSEKGFIVKGKEEQILSF